jgi:membrane-associated phospholipid phosphatase
VALSVPGVQRGGIVSTLSEGGHALTDVVTGIAVALAALAVAAPLYRAYSRGGLAKPDAAVIATAS